MELALPLVMCVAALAAVSVVSAALAAYAVRAAAQAGQAWREVVRALASDRLHVLEVSKGSVRRVVELKRRGAEAAPEPLAAEVEAAVSDLRDLTVDFGERAAASI